MKKVNIKRGAMFLQTYFEINKTYAYLFIKEF